MDVKISIKGLERNRRMLHGLVNELHTTQNLLLKQLGQDVVAEAQENLRGNGNINTWELHDSIAVLLAGDSFVIVGTEKDWAGFIEYGRGPVRPVTAKVLHWIDKDTGKDVFSMFAKATEPMPFLEPAVISKTSKFADVYSQRILEKIK